MDSTELWDLIETARDEADDPTDADSVAETLVRTLADRDPEVIEAFDVALAGLVAESYLTELWAAAYLINGGASDDGFDYFRGWLIAQGRDTFEAAVADPDSLAEVPAVRGALAGGEELECEAMLGVAWDAYEAATDEELPDAGKIALPELAPMWDFDDDDAMREHLPRLASLAYDVD
ncbi:DUF4240 domain-containing protein [Actinotalea fermentans]|uniref:DUF4240 domain-containing protein n=1 Tax=Actinotalea fermentans TaxID=43671 RepID=A0A511YZ71_9CELL|nr:DUF4240 domain-containing protein [Actinotalea fermentans]KGM15146.1 hypothetical protein N867_11660 [Actinotalea fermentans ATCC 43279 = JCM 9966 = DSM 3133]GEN80498.1 hypothetical protein AFE02nite_22320 [Actinotalea fermentans]